MKAQPWIRFRTLFRSWRTSRALQTLRTMEKFNQTLMVTPDAAWPIFQKALPTFANLVLSGDRHRTVSPADREPD